MSRIGKLPIDIPKGVTITVDSSNLVSVKGPQGEPGDEQLQNNLHEDVH